ncbi:NUDIX hydrolase [Nocardiopsis sp. NPDC006198]|uniref:NUDIX hydrolase n=1 Tax=Nocardiopsis sp. NPDC006198 TaxID=3154472 RepID=UPI0033A612A1
MSTQVKECCGTSVGVLLFDASGRLQLIERATIPAGMAPVAGHALDEHASYEAAAYTETWEEVGLRVRGLRKLATGGHHPGRCRRRVHPGRTLGHTWELYRGELTGAPIASPREVRSLRRADQAQLQRLAERTAAHAAGLLTAAEFAADPGLEPVWCHWLAQPELDLIHLPQRAQERILALAATPPALV